LDFPISLNAENAPKTSEVRDLGLLDYLSPVKTGKKLLELQMALLGKHIYNTLSTDEERSRIREFIDEGLDRGGFGDRRMDDLDERVRYLLVALTMKKTGLDHAMLKDYRVFVKNPFAIEKYGKSLCEAAIKVVRERHGIETGFQDPS